MGFGSFVRQLFCGSENDETNSSQPRTSRGKERKRRLYNERYDQERLEALQREKDRAEAGRVETERQIRELNDAGQKELFRIAYQRHEQRQRKRQRQGKNHREMQQQERERCREGRREEYCRSEERWKRERQEEEHRAAERNLHNGNEARQEAERGLELCNEEFQDAERNLRRRSEECRAEERQRNGRRERRRKEERRVEERRREESQEQELGDLHRRNAVEIDREEMQQEKERRREPRQQATEWRQEEHGDDAGHQHANQGRQEDHGDAGHQHANQTRQGEHEDAGHQYANQVVAVKPAKRKTEAGMNNLAVYEVMVEIARRFGHMSYAVCGLGAMVYYGYPTTAMHVSIICPMESKSALGCWAIAQQIHPRGSKNVWSVRTSNGMSRSMRVRFLNDVFQEAHIVKVPGCAAAVLSLPGLIDEIARSYVRDLPKSTPEHLEELAKRMCWTLGQILDRNEQQHWITAERVPNVLREEFWLPFSLAYPAIVTMMKSAGLVVPDGW